MSTHKIESTFFYNFIITKQKILEIIPPLNAEHHYIHILLYLIQQP